MCDPDGFIKFAGMILSSKGLSPDPDKMSVIQDFPDTSFEIRPPFVVRSLSTIQYVVSGIGILSKWSPTPGER